MTKIIDYFPFFIEKELLELRINLLKDYVDKFIISETNKTHNGEDKEFICNKIIDELNLPKNKIQVIETIIPEDHLIIPEECDYVHSSEAKSLKIKNWSRERIQRDALMNHIHEYDDDAVFILSDCDEIINPIFLPYFSSCCKELKTNFIKVPLVLLEGRADKRLYDGEMPADWSKSLVLCSGKHLKSGGSPTKFRGNYSNLFSPLWVTENDKVIQDCGWHFTWMGDENLKKYKARTSVLSDNLSELNTLSSSSMKEIIGNYDNNLTLKNYPLEFLPQVIFELPTVKNFLLPEEIKFDWGSFNNEEYKTSRDYVKNEIAHGVYTKFFDVEKDDIVFDIGASVGPFTDSIMNKLPKEVHCFEPSKNLFETLSKNLLNYDNVFLNCYAISNYIETDVIVNSVYDFDSSPDKNVVNTITFESYIKNNNIEKIDFLKTDCEGGEWSIFTPENYDWIHKNVRKITGEFHLFDLDMKKSFITFRDLYLKNAKNVVGFVSNQYAAVEEIDIWNDDYINYNLMYCNISFEYDTNKQFTFATNKNNKNTSWIVDNFYEDPDAVREFALKQEYVDGGLGRGFIGNRTEQQFLFPGLKEKFEEIMGREITAWQEHGMNGRFQFSWAGQPLVYHCDSQKWGGMLYLTPGAPYSCGTTLCAHKTTRARTYYDDGWDAAWRDVPGDCHLDGSSFEPVDVLGNVYNRLVIFDASAIHTASQYFGTVRENARLWQMFFFDTL